MCDEREFAAQGLGIAPAVVRPDAARAAKRMLEQIRRFFRAGPGARLENDAECHKAEAELALGHLPEAAARFERVLSQTPRHWNAMVGVARVSLQAGDLHKAIGLYDELLTLQPDYAEGHYKKANAYNRLNQLEAALDSYDQAIKLDPAHAFAFCNRGTVLERLGRQPEALSSYERAIELSPQDAFSYYNRASALKSLARLAEALQSYDAAIGRNGAYLEAHVNRGLLLEELGRDEEALRSFDRALQLDAASIESLQGRATCLLRLKRLPEAIAAFDGVLNLQPDRPYARGLRRYAQLLASDWREYHEDLAAIESDLRAGKRVVTPFACLTLFDEPELHLLAARIWVDDRCSIEPPLSAITAHQPGSKIRIGYFSPDFRAHPVAALFVEILERHNRSDFELIGFDFGPLSQDAMHTRLEEAFDQFLDVRGMTDRDLALLARKMNIDVAVDLAGFTEHNRARVFAFRAAPVQISYLGYPGTTGVDAMDYFIADREVVPPEMQSAYVESLAYIAPCVLPVALPQAVQSAAPSRYELGLPEDRFVFCCFNNAYKVNPPIFDVWMRILRRVSSSVLWLSWSSDQVSESLQNEAIQRAVDPNRLIFARRTALHTDHIARLRAADLFLDTSPYGAHATAIDALSAGLPLLTCRGRAFAARVPTSLLTAVRVPELIVRDMVEYEERAVELAKDANLLKGLAQRLKDPPTLELTSHVRDLERIYRDLGATSRVT